MCLHLVFDISDINVSLVLLLKLVQSYGFWLNWQNCLNHIIKKLEFFKIFVCEHRFASNSLFIGVVEGQKRKNPKVC